MSAENRSAPGVLLSGARIVLPTRVAESASLLINNDRIARLIETGRRDHPRVDSVLDLQGTTIFPGFLDVHIHGAAGIDTMEASAEDLLRVSQYLAGQGVTAWLPTLVPASTEQYKRAIDSIAALMQTQREHWERGRPARSGREGDSFSKDNIVTERAERPGSQQERARALGVHYEGPFVNSEQCGALHREHFRTFSSGADIDALPTLPDHEAVHLMTLAPEVTGGVQLARELTGRGWIVSIGHTRADFDLLDQAYEAGARHLTHFMNAMPPLHHRSPGPVGWGLSRDDVTCDIIADGIHLDASILRLLLKVKSPARLALISDAIAAAGLGDGEYQIWGETISVSGGRTQNARGSIAGSVISMLAAVRKMTELGVGEVDVARMASSNPARLLGISNECGSIEEGKRADLVALDRNGKVRLTLVGGQVAYAAQE